MKYYESAGVGRDEGVRVVIQPQLACLPDRTCGSLCGLPKTRDLRGLYSYHPQRGRAWQPPYLSQRLPRAAVGPEAKGTLSSEPGLRFRWTALPLAWSGLRPDGVERLALEARPERPHVCPQRRLGGVRHTGRTFTSPKYGRRCFSMRVATRGRHAS